MRALIGPTHIYIRVTTLVLFECINMFGRICINMYTPAKEDICIGMLKYSE